MKRFGKTLSLLLALTLVLGIFAAVPATARAAGRLVPVDDDVELAAALLGLQDDDTILLTDNIDYEGGIYIDKTVTFNLDGFDLNVTCIAEDTGTEFGSALEVDGGELILIENGGEFNVTSTVANGVIAENGGIATVTNATGVFSVEAWGGSSVTVTGNVTGAIRAVYADNSSVEIYGDVYCSSLGGDYGYIVFAEGNSNDAYVHIHGKTTGNGYIWATGNASILVDGDVSLACNNDAGAQADEGASIIVGGSVSVSGDGATGAFAEGGAVITIGGNLSGDRSGVAALGDGTSVTVSGNVTATALATALDEEDELDTFGVAAYNGAVVDVGRSIFVNGGTAGFGAVAIMATVTVGGSITITGNDYEYICGTTAVGSAVTIGGNITISGTVEFGVGVNTFDGAEVMVKGTINVGAGDIYILFGADDMRDKSSGVTSATHQGYLEYTDYVDDDSLPYSASYVWVRVADSGWVPPVLTQKHVRYLFGYDDGTLHPDEDITRAEAAVFLFRLIEDANKEAFIATSLTDVPTDSWCYQAVAYLNKAGIIEGYPDGTFRPDGLITRAEFAAITARFGDLVENAPQAFPDVPNGYWAAPFINSAAAKGWLTGFPSGVFMPEANVTRAQAVVTINRMLNRVIKLENIPESVPGFSDLTTDHWAYADLIEAATGHEYTRNSDGSETWTTWDK